MNAVFRFPKSTLLAVLLSSLPVPAQVTKLPPLPEIQEIDDLEFLQGQRFERWVASKVDFTDEGKPYRIWSSWFDRKILVGKMEGKTVYLVKTKGEKALPDELCHTTLQEMALYDETFGLIASRRLIRNRGKNELERIRWQEGKLLLWEGKRKKPKEIEAPGRPYMREAIFLKDKGLRNGKKKIVPILDVEKRQVREVEFEREPGTMTYAGKKVYSYKSDEDGGVAYLIHAKDGAWIYSQPEDSGWYLEGTKSSKLKCALHVYQGMLVTEAVTKAALKAWKGRKRDWSNALLGIKLRLPKKDWASNKAIHDGDVFLAYGGKRNAVFTIEVHAVPDSVDLEDIVDERLKTIKKGIGNGGSTSKRSLKIAGRPGWEIKASRNNSRGSTLSDTYRFVISKGYFLEFLTICHEDDINKWTKDFDSIWSKIRLKK